MTGETTIISTDFDKEYDEWQKESFVEIKDRYEICRTMIKYTLQLVLILNCILLLFIMVVISAILFSALVEQFNFPNYVVILIILCGAFVICCGFILFFCCVFGLFFIFLNKRF